MLTLTGRMQAVPDEAALQPEGRRVLAKARSFADKYDATELPRATAIAEECEREVEAEKEAEKEREVQVQLPAASPRPEMGSPDWPALLHLQSAAQADHHVTVCASFRSCLRCGSRVPCCALKRYACRCDGNYDVDDDDDGDHDDDHDDGSVAFV